MNISGKQLLVVISILGLLGGLWLLTNYEPQRIGEILTGLSAASLIVVLAAGPLARSLGNTQSADGAGIVDIRRSLGLGIAFGVILLFLSTVVNLTLVIPVVTYSVGASKFLAVTAQGFITVLVAPIIEEVFFLFVIPFVIYSLLYAKIKSNAATIAITVVLSSAAFALFHYYAYGASLLLSGAFLGAALFRLITLLIVVLRGGTHGFTIGDVTPTILSAIIMHAIFNFAVFTKYLVVSGT